MCNFMGYKVSRKQFLDLLETERQFGTLEALKEVRSGFEFDNWAVAVPTGDKKDYDVVHMHWEYIPNWVSSMKEMEMIRKGLDPKTGLPKFDKFGKRVGYIPWLNARNDQLLTSPMWKDAAKSRRCLAIASWFFESRHVFPIGKKTGKPLKTAVKFPYKVSLKDKDHFYIAAVWNPWTDRETGEMLNTFALVTTDANSVMEQIHNSKKRMPAILPKELAKRWIMDDLNDNEILELASHKISPHEMSYHIIPKNYLESSKIDEFSYEDCMPFEVMNA